MSRFGRSLSAEFRKVTATKLWWIMIIVIAVYSAIMAGTFAALFGSMASAMEGEADLMLEGQNLSGMVYSASSSFAYVVPLLFGALLATGELRHRILGLAFVAEPNREIVLGAKLVTLTVFGLVLGAAGLLGSVGVGAPIFAALGGATGFDQLDTWLLMIRSVIALALWAIIGFGMGLLLRNQAAAIVIALVFTQFLEPTLRAGAMFWEWSASIARFFPGAATDAFVGASLLNSMGAMDPSVGTGVEAFNVWQGGLVLLALAALIVFAGWALRWRKDVQ